MGVFWGEIGAVNPNTISLGQENRGKTKADLTEVFTDAGFKDDTLVFLRFIGTGQEITSNETTLSEIPATAIYRGRVNKVKNHCGGLFSSNKVLHAFDTPKVQ